MIHKIKKQYKMAPSAPKACPAWLEVLFDFFDKHQKGPKLAQHHNKIKELWPQFYEKHRAAPKEKKEPDGVKNMAKATKQISEKVASTPDDDQLVEQISNAMCEQMASLPEPVKEKLKQSLGAPSGPSSRNTSVEGHSPGKVEEIKRIYTDLCTEIENHVDDTDAQEHLIESVSSLYETAMKYTSVNTSSISHHNTSHAEDDDEEKPRSKRSRKNNE